jgi:hypothetical protein
MAQSETITIFSEVRCCQEQSFLDHQITDMPSDQQHFSFSRRAQSVLGARFGRRLIAAMVEPWSSDTVHGVQLDMG